MESKERCNVVAIKFTTEPQRSLSDYERMREIARQFHVLWLLLGNLKAIVSDTEKPSHSLSFSHIRSVTSVSLW